MTDLSQLVKKTIKTKFNGEIIEFYGDSAKELAIDYNLYDDLRRIGMSWDQDLHDAIYGQRNPVNVIQIDAKTYWRVMLMSRHLKHVTGTFYSVSKCIEILTTGHKFFNPKKDNQVEYPLDIEETQYRKLSRLLKGLTFVIYLNMNDMFILDNNQERETHSLQEIFIPDITWELVPLFRYILLAYAYPELVSDDEWKHLSYFTNNKNTNHNYSENEDFGRENNFFEANLDIDLIVSEAKKEYPKILKENKEIIDSGKKLSADQKNQEHYFKILSGTTDKMIDQFKRKFDLFVRVTRHKGKYTEIDRMFASF